MAEQSLKVFVVGGDILEIVERVLMKTVKTVKTVNANKLGNFNLFMCEAHINEEEIIAKRKEIAKAIMDASDILMPLFDPKDWMRIFVFNRFTFKTQYIMKT